MTDAHYDVDVDELTSSITAEVLPAWNLSRADIDLISVSENITFRVRDREHNETYVLRAHRPSYHTLAELESEQMWTEALNSSGIPVPISVKSNSGKGYVSFTMPGGKQVRFVGIARWLNGQRLVEHDSANIADRYRALGGVMAAMHNQAVGWKPPAGFTRHAFDADGLMGDAPFWGRFWEHPGLTADQRTLLVAARQVIHDRLSGMPKSNGRYSMIHADLHESNLLVDGDGLRVIDFDDAGFGFHLYDIAVALYQKRNQDNYSALRDAMMDGYANVRSQTALSLEDLPMFLLIRGLALLGWINARPEIDQNRVPSMIASACSMAAAFLDSAVD